MVRGARQVGKSSSIRHLGESFDYFVEINFETRPEYRQIFIDNKNVIDIVSRLSLLAGIPIVENKTLLFLDEVQSCPEALHCLWAFKEDMPHLHVVAAGSLLEFTLKKMPSFGVGRIRSVFMYPMSFDEFLYASGYGHWVEAKSKATYSSPLPPELHDALVREFRSFLIVGGMPASVIAWIESHDYLQCSEELEDIQQTYYDDFAKYAEKINTIQIIGISMILVGIPLLLIFKQPDTSTSIAIALIFISLLFIAGLSYKIVMTVLGITIPVGLIGFSMILHMAQTSDDYRFGRIMAWLYPKDKRWAEIADQQQNSIMAIGSGQLWGKGLNNSVATSMKNANYIVEPQTDFIFAVAGEELGFIGTTVIICLLLFIAIECILIARKAKDLSGKLICCGMAALVGFQSVFNLFVATGLMPNTGIPLPFVSYGLTSLLSMYMGMGFVLNVGLQPKKY